VAYLDWKEWEMKATIWRTVLLTVSLGWLVTGTILLMSSPPLRQAQSIPDKAPETTEPDKPVDVLLSLEGSPAMGDAAARVGLVEFSDYGCPYCAMHAGQTLPQIVADYVKTNKVRYFFKDLPVEAMHPQAFKAAQAARCAGAQDRYWPMHDRLFKNQRPQIVDELRDQALALKLDVERFVQCVDADTYAIQIRNDIAEAKQSKIKGTPTFFVGKLDPKDSRMRASVMIYGSQPYAAFQTELDRLLAAPQ
jgi:protein-disulfide isomerase